MGGTGVINCNGGGKRRMQNERVLYRREREQVGWAIKIWINKSRRHVRRSRNVLRGLYHVLALGVYYGASGHIPHTFSLVFFLFHPNHQQLHQFYPKYHNSSICSCLFSTSHHCSLSRTQQNALQSEVEHQARQNSAIHSSRFPCSLVHRFSESSESLSMATNSSSIPRSTNN